MSIVAVIDKSNAVINVIVAEDTDLPPLNCILVNTPDNQGNTPSIGWTYDGTKFINPNPIDLSDYGN